MSSRAVLVAAACCVAWMIGVQPASAENKKGAYLGIMGGINAFPEDSDVGAGEADLDNDWVAAGTVGYGFGNGLRMEAEIGYRPNDVDGISGVTGGTGDYKTFNWMANVLYDFGRLKWPVTPYIGVGVGIANVDLDGVAPVTGGSINDDDFGFAFQGIAGLAFDVTDNLSLTADYRHLRVPDLTFKTATGPSVDSDYATNQFMVGLRYRFGAPEPKPAPKPEPVQQPAPAPAPAPAPPPKAKAVPKEFIVFFDFDSAKLTPEAMEIVRDAAAQAKSGGYSRIQLTGHTDLAGPASYNLGLSKRRAESVKKALTELGLPANEIATKGVGETNPLVPTADGVPEPQNRRVEIFMPQ